MVAIVTGSDAAAREEGVRALVARLWAARRHALRYHQAVRHLSASDRRTVEHEIWVTNHITDKLTCMVAAGGGRLVVGRVELLMTRDGLGIVIHDPTGQSWPLDNAWSMFEVDRARRGYQRGFECYVARQRARGVLPLANFGA